MVIIANISKVFLSILNHRSCQDFSGKRLSEDCMKINKKPFDIFRLLQPIKQSFMNVVKPAVC